jgi:hypothetical protein
MMVPKPTKINAPGDAVILLVMLGAEPRKRLATGIRRRAFLHGSRIIVGNYRRRSTKVTRARLMFWSHLVLFPHDFSGNKVQDWDVGSDIRQCSMTAAIKC